MQYDGNLARSSSNWTGRAPRTMEEAFGCSDFASALPVPRRRLRWPRIVAIAIVTLVALGQWL